MAADIASRKSHKSTVSKLVNSVDRYIAEEDKNKLNAIVHKLKQAFINFEDSHEKVHATVLEDDEKVTQSDSYLEEVHVKYVEALTRAKFYLKEAEAKQPVYHETDTNVSNLAALINLPRVELEKFDGDPLKYHTFIALFEESVDKVTSDCTMKLTRLLHYTTGKARDCIRPCVLMKSGHGYDHARKLLHQRFGNDHLITERILASIKQGKQVKTAYDLQQLADELSSSFMTLSQLHKLKEIESQSCILEVVNRLQPYIRNRWRRHAVDFRRDTGNYPYFKELVDFVCKQALEANDPVYGDKAFKTEHSRPKAAAAYATDLDNTVYKPSLPKFPCVLCNDDHKLFGCDKFRKMKPIERIQVVKKFKLCENCLYSNHKVEECRKPTICSVPGCGKKHTKFIHVFQNDSVSVDLVSNQNMNVIESSVNEGESDVTSHQVFVNANETGVKIVNANETDVKIVNANTECYVDVFLPIVPVRVNDQYNTFALLDPGSTSTFCSRELVNKLQIQGSNKSYVLNTLSQSQEVKHTQVVSLNLKSRDGNESLNISNVYVMDTQIPVKCPSVNTDRYPHLSDLNFGEIDSNVDVLIGQDNAELLMPLEVRKGRKGEPFAVRSLFGWSLNGPILVDSPVSKTVISHFVTTSLEDKVQDLWKLENEGIAETLTWSQDDKKVMKLWNDKINFVDGHYSFPIPWKDDAFVPNNLSVARSRLVSLNSSLKKKGIFAQYDFEIEKLIEKGYAEKVQFPDVSSQNIWYLPHHAVITDKKPGKTRVVFDCASRFCGESLNEKCLQGPDLNNKLLYVLLRFRQHEYAFMADIEAMYYQVVVLEEDRDALRFLWYDKAGNIVHFRMTRHVFGGIWCSSVATHALRRTVEDFPGFDSLITETIQNSFYVDDCLKSVDIKQNAQLIVEGTRELLAKGGFKLTKCVSNDSSLLIGVPDKEKQVNFDGQISSSENKALGIRWDVVSDKFYFKVDLCKDGIVTRKIMLSLVASMFDPLGLISPILVTGKMCFQDATRLKLSWDEAVSSELKNKWLVWIRSLSDLKDLDIPRCVKPGNFNDSFQELHHFSDASERAYGCCSYLRCVNKLGEIIVSLVASKGKVAPIKSVSIPRLELQAALLSVKMDSMLSREMELSLSRSYFWVDSECVLKYIRNASLRLHVFVANRIGKIHEMSEPDQWHHVSGKINPADVLTRGQTPMSLDHNKWFYGPEFLSTYKSEWDIQEVVSDLSLNDPEVKSKQICDTGLCTVTAKQHPIDKLVDYYSSWYKMKRALCWLRRFMEILKGNRQNVGKLLTVDELRSAEISIVKHAQSQTYENEIKRLSKGEQVSRSSSLKDLSPMLNQVGIMCVGGRLSYSSVNETQKHPWIISHKHPLACIIVREFHNDTHLGTEWILSLLRKKFWITRARVLIKRVGSSCVTCKKLFGTPTFQKMSDLPPERLQPDKPPFTFVGVDCFGPFLVKRARSEVKRYGCIFTCLTTRAIHIEKLNYLDTDSFLNGFRRFVSRRGSPQKVWSDNGSNFVGGLAELHKSENVCKIQEYCLRRNFEWNFNPPYASHMGGVWERLIRTIRKVFASLLKNARLTDEIFETLLSEVESIVNSRPITKVSDHVDDLSALTPNHLLLLREGPCPPPGIYKHNDMYCRRWKYVQFLSDQFWRKWIQEYLPELQRRNKWLKPQRNVKVGDLVLIFHENTPRSLWPLAIVDDVKYGRDNLVRSVKVRTKSTVLVRPVSKIVLLEGM